MRTAFIEALCEQAEQNERIWLLAGDLGFSVLEKFSDRFPDRYINAGVAEQNMTGVAAGLALSGKIVFTYSIANFPIMRCLEQIRNDVCCHNANVKIVAVGGGYAYGYAGYSHHAVEDMAVMGAMPNMTVLAPGDPDEAGIITKYAVNLEGPCYIRLDKAGKATQHTQPLVFDGQAIRIRNGRDLTLISTGGVLSMVMAAAAELEARGISADVLSMPQVYPIDSAAVIDAAQRTGRIITVEEHGVGGLGTAVAELLAASGSGTKFIARRLPNKVVTVAGSQAQMRSAAGLSVESIIETAEKIKA